MSDEVPEYEYRKRCLREKGEECTVCGETENVLVHHVDGDRTNNSLDNLIPVCEQCHADIHAKRDHVSEWVAKLESGPVNRGNTTVEVKDETWAKLNRQKDIGDSFDDVIQRLLEE